MKINKNWTTENIPDQKGKIVIVTGSNSGIGFEISKALAKKNAKVILAVRNTEKGEKAKSNILSLNNSVDVEVMKIDLSDLSSVKSFVETYISKYERLDILINNAGVMMPPYTKTKDGFELQFATNYLGHFALTIQLISLLKNTPNSRVVNVSGIAHKTGKINFSDLNWEKRKYKPWQSYCDTKLANLLFSNELSTKIKDIKVVGSHPGWVSTELKRNSKLFTVLNKIFSQNPVTGALPILRAAIEENVESGDYFGPNGWQEWKGYPIKVDTNKLAKDTAVAKKLWDVSEELTKTKFNLN